MGTETETDPLVLVETTIVTPPVTGLTTPEMWDAWYGQLRLMGTAALDAFGICPIDECPGVPEVNDDDEFFEGDTLVRERVYRAAPFELVLNDQIDTGGYFTEGPHGSEGVAPTGEQEVSVRRTFYVYVDDPSGQIEVSVFSSAAKRIWAEIEGLREWLTPMSTDEHR